MITLVGKTIPLETALHQGKITMWAILSRCNQDVLNGAIDDLMYRDGGSRVYRYQDYAIVKYHTLDGNNDMYIGTPDIDIYVKDR